MAVTTTHTPITGLWAADVKAVEKGIAHFKVDRAAVNDCQVALFEIPRDNHLHVNITHQYPTKVVAGWAGPASLPRGFVHNRTFLKKNSKQIVGHIREMVFATRA